MPVTLAEDDQAARDEAGGSTISIGGITRPKFSTEAKENYNQVSDWAQDAWGISTKSEISGRINEVAYQFYNENGQRWPSATELFQYGNFQQAMNVYASGTPFLPPFFRVDGQMYSNDALYGPKIVDQFHPAFADTSAARDLGGVLGSLPEQNGLTLGQSMARGLGRDPLPGFQDLFANVPSTTAAELSDILVGLRPGRSGGGGGGGGGGAARPDLVFDEAQLAERARAIWRPMMIADVPDTEGLVDKYLKEANSFWRGSGGRLDFDTFVTNEARTTQRYKNLYGKKEDWQSEAEYMGGFTAAANGFGLSAGETEKQIVAGATSGASLAGFTSRVSRGRENQLNTQGNFSQKMANNLNQLGAIGRS